VLTLVPTGTLTTTGWAIFPPRVTHFSVTGTPSCTALYTLHSVPEDCVLLDGGPAMGPVIDPNKAVITKTTKGLLVLPKEIPAVVSKLSPMRVQLNRATSPAATARCAPKCARARSSATRSSRIRQCAAYRLM